MTVVVLLLTSLSRTGRPGPSCWASSPYVSWGSRSPAWAWRSRTGALYGTHRRRPNYRPYDGPSSAPRPKTTRFISTTWPCLDGTQIPVCRLGSRAMTPVVTSRGGHAGPRKPAPAPSARGPAALALCLFILVKKLLRYSSAAGRADACPPWPPRRGRCTPCSPRSRPSRRRRPSSPRQSLRPFLNAGQLSKRTSRSGST